MDACVKKGGFQTHSLNKLQNICRTLESDRVSSSKPIYVIWDHLAGFSGWTVVERIKHWVCRRSWTLWFHSPHPPDPERNHTPKAKTWWFNREMIFFWKCFKSNFIFPKLPRLKKGQRVIIVPLAWKNYCSKRKIRGRNLFFPIVGKGDSCFIRAQQG